LHPEAGGPTILDPATLIAAPLTKLYVNMPEFGAADEAY
jgi:hypothetical protein